MPPARSLQGLSDLFFGESLFALGEIGAALAIDNPGEDLEVVDVQHLGRRLRRCGAGRETERDRRQADDGAELQRL